MAKKMGKLITIAKGYIKSFFPEKYVGVDEDIDIVVTWVDGSDSSWVERMNAYKKLCGEPIDNGVCRYRDWDIFRYWFRSVEKYAPWVHKVYLVTEGHLPKWINRECEKLEIVRHDDFIPSDYLPTFSSIPIELNLHRISGLSEHFVYFNDDMYFAAPCSKEDFFYGDAPVLCALAAPAINIGNYVPYHAVFSTIGEINAQNSIARCIEEAPEKWFSHLYGGNIKYNVMSYMDNYLYGIYFSHMGVPMKKSTMEKAWEKYDAIPKTCKNKFRTPMDVFHLIFTAEEALSGNFVPVQSGIWGQILPMENITDIKNALENQSMKMFCLSDRDNYTDDEIMMIQGQLKKVFEVVFSEKSKYEL